MKNLNGGFYYENSSFTHTSLLFSDYQKGYKGRIKQACYKKVTKKH